MPLRLDICRCRGISNDHGICERRNGCARYVAAVNGEFGPRTPCADFMCQLGESWFIQYVGKAPECG